MRTLLATTEDFIKRERTKIGSAATAGSSVTIVLENNNGFSNSDYIVIGYEGSELCEMQQINQAVTPGTNVRVATLKFNHLAGEPVVLYRFNQRKFYGSATAGGSYTELTSEGSPKDIQVDDPQGTFLEYDGATYNFFKSTYYNSTTSDETDIDDSDAVDADESKRYASIYAIRKHAGLQGNPFYSDSRIETKRKQAENEINSVLYARYTLPLAEVPALLGQICELLAAGYIDFEEFGKDGEGVKWLGVGRSLLGKIADGTQRLIGTDGEELAQKTLTQGVQSYPDGVDNTDGPIRMFTTQQTF